VNAARGARIGIRMVLVHALAAAPQAAVVAPVPSDETTAAAPASPPSRTRALDVWVAGGYLGGLAGHGAALASGLRLGLGEHVALGFDLGYGVLHGGASAEDRWWLVPSVAGVARAGRVRFDLGAGLGLGASSGYASFSAYAAAPFSPVWAFQLVPVARASVLAAMPLTQTTRGFLRIDVASLLLSGNSVGLRAGSPDVVLASTSWVCIALGAETGIL
jgi:hypothetical protein